MSSSYNTITISDQEWMNIQRCISDTEIYVTRKKEEAERIRNEAKRREQELNEMREQVNKTVDSAAKMLEGEFVKMARDISDTSRQEAEKQSEALKGEIENLRNEINETARATADVSNKVLRISQKFTENIKAVVEQQDTAKEQAERYQNGLKDICQRIDEMKPEVFAPGTYSEVKQLINSAEINLDSGNYQAALISCQNGIAKASALLTNLIVANDRFNKEVTELAEESINIRTQFDKFDKNADGAIIFELEGEKVECDYDIDHWSHGQYSELRSEFERLEEQLITAIENRATEGELADLRRSLDDLKAKLHTCDINARKEYLGSLKATEIAARICDSLCANNMILEENGFVDGDDRNPYTMVLKDGAGNETAFVISPGENAEIPAVAMEVFAEDESKAEAIKRSTPAIMAANGMNIDSSARLNDCADNKDPEAFKRNAVQRAKAQDKARRKKAFHNM